ncbi:Hypothetical protein A7982_11719 [Minicystis rosea]|nr:Hypothetical protein A7982_11719 [Minicystis rosea]
MAITLNHTIVPARDKARAAAFLVEMLGLGPATPRGPFAAVHVNPSLDLDYADSDSFEPHHYAFHVTDAEFDAIFARVTGAGIVYSSDPHQKDVGRINHRYGGRGFYFRDPEGHVLEVLTRAEQDAA